ncbi:MAG TPA: trehalose-6-phosphate synthase [Candidatus Eisenbacteria bacterium]|nr:trehalose-6-phosphate synthase [Candidatus Eisenbacteria bacterium]
MRITLRLILSLIVGVALVAAVFSYVQVREERQRLREETRRKSAILAESLEETVEPLLETRSEKKLQRIVERFGNRERLAGVAVYDAKGRPVAITPSLSASFQNPPEAATQSSKLDKPVGVFQSVDGKPLHIYALPLHRDDTLVGELVILYDTSHIGAEANSTWRLNFLWILVQMLIITLVTILIVRWSIAGPISKTAEWMKRLRSGEDAMPAALPQADFFKPIAQEVVHLTASLSAARAAAEEEARLRDAAESVWTPERLKEHVRNKLQGRPLFVVSNREPYMHTRKGREIVVTEPASGLVTALDPILRACGGTWVAHGAGDADMEMVDAQNKLMVPPHDPLFTLKRVWITKEEEEGYYFGFSNEGLWPLCHIAHTRPTFRADDWADYQAVNTKFAESVVEELEGCEEPLVLIQDYHFALLPQLIKQRRPDARVAIFWHIPWPNPEAFRICPWQSELLDGLLGADLLGFHTQYHCNNFLETADRALESRIDWDRFAVNRHGHTTLVKPFPISIAFPQHEEGWEGEPTKTDLKFRLFRELGVEGWYLGVGVDRIDYTKGIVERFQAIERFLEHYPAYRGKLVFVELGAPSRTHIKKYHDLVAEVEAEADRINWKFQTKTWKPIIFRKAHHTHEDIRPYYRAADFCLVTSLHDGMNLVAKEYVGACEDEQGVLILSCFTGASRELLSALIVNPYDIEQAAEAIRYALEMPSDERQSRMHRMRMTVKDANVYAWAASLISELSQIPEQVSEAPH